MLKYIILKLQDTKKKRKMQKQLGRESRFVKKSSKRRIFTETVIKAKGERVMD